MSDNEVRMRFADDGQPNFSDWQPRPIGEVGQYGERIIWTRLGQYTQRVYTFESSSPRGRDMLALVATLEPTR